MIDMKMAPNAALLLRVSMGIMFLIHGFYYKILVFGLAGTAGFFHSIGLPGWFGWLVAIYETIGGICLILGIQTRWVSNFLGVHLLAAALIVHVKNGYSFSAKGGGWEFPVFWAIACFSLALLGDGAYALMPSVKSGG